MLVEELEKPAVVVITEEFITIASRIAALKGHASLRQLILPYPLETRPEDDSGPGDERRPPADSRKRFVDRAVHAEPSTMRAS